MTTVCKIFDDEASARSEVESLIARGVPGEDVRVLRGAPQRDAREDAHGSFAAGHGDDPMGTFAGPERTAVEGSFAPGHDAHAERLGTFGNVDRDTVTTFPCAVEDVSVVSHHRLVALLAEAGLDRETAEADVEALHEGKLLVVARVPSDVAA
ncbi:MAG: hypothetical protein ICV69_15995 [Thermoleophilaceae bacterium]|nr:hypothetical protein [Thermoleophilaceae bacterium]